MKPANTYSPISGLVRGIAVKCIVAENTYHSTRRVAGSTRRRKSEIPVGKETEKVLV